MTIAALYARVSTDEQAEHGYSIDAQRDACRAFATARGWVAGQEYVDAGFSGGKSDRPAWQQMIADARAGAFQVLIVHKLDRFSRDVLAGLRVIADLRAAGERRTAEILAEQKRLDVLFQRGRIDQARWESEVARLDVELASLAPTAAPATSVEIRTLLDTWHEIADGLEDKREILSVLLTSVDVDLSTGRIVAWHARPEYATAIALATREK